MSQSEVLRYMMPVCDMRKDELENAVIELRAEVTRLKASWSVAAKVADGARVERVPDVVAEDRAYVNGARFGWNCGVTGDRKKFDSAIDSREAWLRRAPGTDDAGGARPAARQRARHERRGRGGMVQVDGNASLRRAAHEHADQRSTCRRPLFAQHAFAAAFQNEPPKKQMPDGADLIAEERARQRTKEGWTAEHDDDHDDGALASAACCYAFVAAKQAQGNTGPFHQDHVVWPWDEEWWKPKDQLRNLVRAGALIAAEIDRLQRKTPDQESGGHQHE